MVDIIKLDECERQLLVDQANRLTKVEILELLHILYEKDSTSTLQALLKLYYKSNDSNEVYPYFDTLVDLLRSKNSFQRTRGIFLISINSKWDTHNKLDAIINEFLSHVEDEKSITSRQCIKSIENILPYKPNLIPIIKNKLQDINYSLYTSNMQNLLFQDVSVLLDKIKNLY